MGIGSLSLPTLPDRTTGPKMLRMTTPLSRVKAEFITFKDELLACLFVASLADLGAVSD